jgi:hypothetical protein
MTISYNWLHEYLPVTIEPEKLSRILTSIGLEVESMEAYEEVKGGLQGVVIGQVLTCEKHPDADKLSLTTVNIGKSSGCYHRRHDLSNRWRAAYDEKSKDPWCGKSWNDLC